MALKFNFTVTEEEVREKWAEQTSAKNWINMYTKLSDSFENWDIDLELAEFIVKRVKEGFIDKYREDDIPEVLKPLLFQANCDDLERKNRENKKITLEDVSGIAELTAIEKLRKYDSLDYTDAVNLFCDGYDLAMEEKRDTTFDLSNVDAQDLIKELKDRL